MLGTYRDLWATDVTKRNPALRFLMPKQKLELAAEGRRAARPGERRRGRRSPSTATASRRRSRSASGCGEGAAFLIEGTDEANGNVLTNGVPPRIEVEKR